jgi:hypothetical protein
MVSIGETGTIPFAMRQNRMNFFVAALDTKEGSEDGNRWKSINTWALTRSWPRERASKSAKVTCSSPSILKSGLKTK